MRPGLLENNFTRREFLKRGGEFVGVFVASRILDKVVGRTSVVKAEVFEATEEMDDSRFVYFDNFPDNIPWDEETKECAWQKFCYSLTRIKEIIGRNNGPNGNKQFFFLRKHEGGINGGITEWGDNFLIYVTKGHEKSIAHEIGHSYPFPVFNNAWHGIQDALRCIVFDDLDSMHGPDHYWCILEKKYPGVLGYLHEWYGQQILGGYDPGEGMVVNQVDIKYPGFADYFKQNLRKWVDIPYY